ncbi:MAG TPA: citrate lyase subunit gamma [Candidatus Cloacimonetes bacterium]|nr:citrate lyase subunit gamma [Candidatus Cloacimonadota bacterium]HEX37848.1 citrate lyase subunit gamma [Candidatus Cloacimonadota bacterium]
MARIGSAGNYGPKVRSDCRVTIELTTSGGIQIELDSKVANFFQEQILALTHEILDHFKVKNAKVMIEDQGALDFVIAARLEAALKDADPSIKESYLPEMKEYCLYGSEKNRLRRSRLYIPGDTPKLALNAGLYEADGIILDLEDSVHPNEKAAARILVRNTLRTIDFKGAERMVRINQLPLGYEDVKEVINQNVHVILIPKCESKAQIIEIAEFITKEKADNTPVYLLPIIESAKGVLFAYEIATAADTIIGLALGLEDYTADIGVRRTQSEEECFFAKSMVLNAAKAAGVQAIDTVYSDVDDMEGLYENVKQAKSMGFDGKGCIHPSQIKVVHEAFLPSPEELERAKQIVEAFEQAEKEGIGVVALGSKMIDPPVVKQAQKILEMARAGGILS